MPSVSIQEIKARIIQQYKNQGIKITTTVEKKAEAIAKTWFK